ncbi:13528_t:CDS:10 [Acaulospora colombiana]|uniref:13528_t:CDS:1 n=1 Tax=Acaulospora colombiana TaxID=27376 RepID=A0ACA9MGF5_9GLOM|nr:13528_t:CDS:10 [Acaulospora colombiana]
MLQQLSANQILSKRQNPIDLISHQLIAAKMPVPMDAPPQFRPREDRREATTESWNSWARTRELEEWLQAVGVRSSSLCQSTTPDLLRRQGMQRPGKQYEFPTGFATTFYQERFLPGECFFSLDAFGLFCITPSLHASQTSRVNYSKTLCSQGEGRCFLKFKLSAASNVIERQYSAWIGGSILASLGTFHQLWISRAEFLGAMTFGDKDSESARTHSTDEINAILDVDTARVYTNGTSERLLGDAKTKLYPGPTARHTPEDLRKTLQASLTALRADKVELFYLHAPDRTTPWEVTFKAVDELHKEGKFDKVTNESSWEVAEIVTLCRHNGWIQPTVYQAEPGSRFDSAKGTSQSINYRKRYWNDHNFKALSIIAEAAEKENLTIPETEIVGVSCLMFPASTTML